MARGFQLWHYRQIINVIDSHIRFYRDKPEIVAALEALKEAFK